MIRTFFAAAGIAAAALGGLSFATLPMAHADDCARYVGHDAMGNDQTGILQGCCAASRLTGQSTGAECNPSAAAPKPDAAAPPLLAPAIGTAPQPNGLPYPAIGAPTGPANPMPGAAPGYAVDPNAAQNVLTGGPCGGPSDPLCVAPPIDPHAPPPLPTAAPLPGE
jgi:hypothetical protein